MQQTTRNRPRIMRSAKRCSTNVKVDHVSLVLIGGLLIVIGMMLRG
jgi:hypothetical protein